MIALGGLFAFAGCGGGGAAGEPIMSGALTGQYAGEAFTPTFGFATLYHDTPLIGVGAGPLNCATPDQPNPPTNINAVFSLPAFEVGSYGSVIVEIYYNRGHFEGTGSNSGLVTVDAVTADSITGSVHYSYTDDESKHYSLDGTFEVMRCPG